MQLPEISEGLEIGGQPVTTHEEGSVNTQAGFEAALGRSVSGEVADPDEQEPEEAPPEEEAPEEEAPEGDAAFWRTRYENMEQVLARQGAELGELRQFAAEARAPAPSQPGGPIDLEALIDENGGARVIDWAIDNSPEMIEETYRLWAASGDPEGVTQYTDFRVEQMRLEMLASAPRQAATETDPALADLALERKLTDVWAEQRQSDPQFDSYVDGIGPALGSADTPDEIKLMLFSGNPDHMRQAVAFLRPYAQLEALRAGVSPANGIAEPPGDTPREEERREQIRRTAIVTGSQRLQAAGEQPGDGELSSEQRVQLFKDRFMDTPSTDISAGLTINGQPVQPVPPRSS